MRKTFNITDKEVLERLQEVDNQSQYIQGLILKDINNSSGGEEFQDGILTTITMLEKCLGKIREDVLSE